jgi:hypothetical protein
MLRMFKNNEITTHGPISRPIKVDKKRTSLLYFLLFTVSKNVDIARGIYSSK